MKENSINIIFINENARVFIIMTHGSWFMIWPLFSDDNFICSAFSFKKKRIFMLVIYIVCFVLVLLSELCVFTTRGAVLSVSACCVCALFLFWGLQAIARANEISVNNRPINNSLLTANGRGSVCLQPIRVQELSWLYLHPQLIIDRIGVMWERYGTDLCFFFLLSHTLCFSYLFTFLIECMKLFCFNN